MSGLSTVTYATMAQYIAYACEQKMLYRWNGLISNIRQTSSCCEKLDLEALRQTLYSLRTSVREAKNFSAECAAFQKYYEPYRLRAICHIPEDLQAIEQCNEMGSQIPLLLTQLVRRVEELARCHFIPAWERAKTEMEPKLAARSIRVGAAFFLGYLPKELGGTWPHIKALLKDFSPLHPSRTKDLLNHRTPPVEQTPPTIAEEARAMSSAVKTLQKILQIPIHLN